MSFLISFAAVSTIIYFSDTMPKNPFFKQTSDYVCIF